MLLTGCVKDFVKGVVSEDNGVMYCDLKTEGLEAIGIREGDEYVFMVAPSEIGSMTGTPLKSKLVERTYHDLVFPSEIVVSMSGCIKPRSSLNRGLSRRLVSHKEFVYPIYSEPGFYLLLNKLIGLKPSV